MDTDDHSDPGFGWFRDRIHLVDSVVGGDVMKPEELHVDYDSPIEIDFATNLISNMTKEMAEHIDNETFHAICQAGFYIDRKKMVQALKQDKERYDDAYRRGYAKREEDIIRCKDCKHYDSETQSCLDGLDGIFQPDWYCADAERREDEDDG